MAIQNSREWSMSWYVWLKEFLTQLVDSRAAAFAEPALSEAKKSKEEEPQIPFWLWHMF